MTGLSRSNGMEEADDWQRFSNLLVRMGPEQAEAFLGLLKDSIHDLT